MARRRGGGPSGRRRRSTGRARKPERRRRSSSSRSRTSSRSSSASSGTSESRQRLFRTARDLGGFANRAQRMALVEPDRVLVESLAELSAILPATRPGASTSVGGGYEAAAKLPQLFVSYHSLILQQRLAASDRGSRNEREARTLCELLDALLGGGTLGAIMIALQRLKAIEASIDPQGGGWQHAAQHELTARPNQGLVSQKDRTLANRDVRDELRSRAPRGLPPLGKGAGKGKDRG